MTAAVLQNFSAHSFRHPGRQHKVCWQRQFLPSLPTRNLWVCFCNLWTCCRFSAPWKGCFVLGMGLRISWVWNTAWQPSGNGITVAWDLQTCLVHGGEEDKVGGWSVRGRGLVLRFTSESSQVNGGKLLWDCQIGIVDLRNTSLFFNIQ